LVDGLRATQPELLGRLVNRLLRQSDELLDVTDWTLDVHGWNMKTKRRQLNCNHILRSRDVFTKLLYIQGTTEHSQHMAMRGWGDVLVLEERSIHVC
jgi:hypothetical protein